MSDDLPTIPVSYPRTEVKGPTAPKADRKSVV